MKVRSGKNCSASWLLSGGSLTVSLAAQCCHVCCSHAGGGGAAACKMRGLGRRCWPLGWGWGPTGTACPLPHLCLVVPACRLAAAAEGKGPKILAQEESSDEEEDVEELTQEELGRPCLLGGCWARAGGKRPAGDSLGALGEGRGQESSDGSSSRASGEVVSGVPFSGRGLEAQGGLLPWATRWKFRGRG